MLKLVDIKKNYVMKNQEPVKALRGVSVNFRQNEFVAVLGPSGCGKTTLLNIIGGLDRYTEGDLIIKNKSTKNYSDYDWDTYRNHSIGFVFQSYNLIGHQTISKNVELALTIAGVDRKERKERAYAALEKVGLKGMEKKRPNQLSGGQMQRVAIARALVNNPEILLADEPTGALDSETSVQIMDLLKEVAKDRLVIMVTHNPDLAERYATRIVNMFDGVITGDSNPFDGKGETYKDEEVVNKGKKKKSSMSFFTATSLSLANLFSKSKRTILVAVAGSIGIFGVSTVLAASTGVRGYIDNMQDDMLSSYPLSVAEEAVDYTSLMTGLYQDPDSKIKDFDINSRVGLNSMIDYLMDRYSDFTSVKTNTINDDLVEFIKEIPQEHLSSLSFNYGIDPTNNIFAEWDATVGRDANGNPVREKVNISLNGLTQRHIAELKTVNGFSQYASYVDLFTDFMKLLPDGDNGDGVFDEKDYSYIRTQYDLLGDSHFPQNENEIMLVVESDTTLTDLVFAQLGYYHEEELMNIAQKAIKKYDQEYEPNKTPEERENLLDELYPYTTSFSYEDLIGKKLTYYPHDTIYGTEPKDVADSDYNAYNLVLRTAGNDEFYTFDYADNSTSALVDGILFTGTHITLNPVASDSVYMIKMADGFQPLSLLGGDFSEIIAKPGEGVDPTSGTYICFDSKVARQLVAGTMNMETMLGLQLVNIPEGNPAEATVEPLSNAFQAMASQYPGFPPYVTPATFNCSKDITAHTEKFAYQYPAEADPSWENGTEMKIAGILRPKKGVSFGCLSRGVYYTREFQDKYMRDAENSAVVKGNNGFMNYITSGKYKTSSFEAYVTFRYTNWSDPANPTYNSTYFANCLNGDLSSSFSSLFSSITGVDNAGENATHFRSLCGLKIVTETNEAGAVTATTFEKLPESINIYPVDFNQKKKVNDYLDQWNKDVDITLYEGTDHVKVLKYADREELTYTDTISLIIGVINTMITIITTALVIFTSLSLVVSSFMIAVITYISVMERVKEIGVIRSLGGRKKDVSRLFIAENLVTGVMSGLIGLGITGIVCMIINIIVSNLAKIPAIVVLTLPIAGIMLGLSVLLSVVAGFIPSLHASRQDPVIALRSE